MKEYDCIKNIFESLNKVNLNLRSLENDYSKVTTKTENYVNKYISNKKEKTEEKIY